MITYEDALSKPLGLRDGSTLHIEVDISGSPRPSVTWYQGESELHETARVTIENNDGWSFIKVKGIKVSDAGTYKVSAENTAGSDSAEFTVNVQGRKSILFSYSYSYIYIDIFLFCTYKLSVMNEDDVYLLLMQVFRSLPVTSMFSKSTRISLWWAGMLPVTMVVIQLLVT